MKSSSKIFILIVVALFIMGIVVYGANKQFADNEVIESIKEELLNAEENTLLYLGSKSCEACDVQAGLFSLLLRQYNLQYYYIDLDELVSNSKKDKLLTDLNLVPIDGNVELPTLAVYNEGRVIDKLEKVNNIDVLFDFLVDNKIIESESKLPLNYLDLSTYSDYLARDGIKILAVTSLGSEYNISFQSALWEFASNNDVTIDVITLDDLSSSELEMFIDSSDFFKSDIFETPILVISNGNNITNYVKEIVTASEYVDIFKNLGIIK